jgi:hypothetical protein
MTTETLPTYEESEAACDAGTATPLHQFIYDNEPSDYDRVWRTQLAAALNHAVLAGVTYRT